MRRRRDIIEKNYRGFERVIAPTAEPRSSNLFAMAAQRLLLGYDEVLPSSWQEAARRAAALLSDPGATLPDKLEVLAYRELAGEDTSGQLRATIPAIDAARAGIDMTMCGLACSMEADESIRDAWFAGGLSRRYIETEQVYLFEMLSLVCSEPSEAERVANAVALVVQSNCVALGPPAAPLVCGLATLARRAGTTARRLLLNRLAMVDDHLFSEGEIPRFRCKGPELTSIDDDTCELRLTIRGDGIFDAGVDPAEGLTRLLSDNLSSLIVGLSRRREGNRQQLEHALERGTCRTVLRLEPKVELSDLDEGLLRRRVRIAWECARHQLRGVGCKEELHIEWKGR